MTCELALAAAPRARVRLTIVQDASDGPVRPRTRGDCSDVPRPCPFVTCRYSLFPELEDAGAVTEPDEVPAAFSCALDVAERDGATLADVAKAIGLAAGGGAHVVIRNAIRSVLRRPSSREVLAQFALLDERRHRTDRVDDVGESYDEDKDLDDTAGDDLAALDALEELASSSARSGSGRLLDDDEAAACATVWRIYERASRERTTPKETDDARGTGDRDAALTGDLDNANATSSSPAGASVRPCLMAPKSLADLVRLVRFVRQVDMGLIAGVQLTMSASGEHDRVAELERQRDIIRRVLRAAITTFGVAEYFAAELVPSAAADELARRIVRTALEDIDRDTSNAH